MVCLEKTVSQYWAHVKEHFLWGTGHPAASDSQHIPLGIHGDECRYTSGSGLQEKIIAMSINVILWAPRSSRNSRFVICAIRESECLGRRTMYPVLEYVRWAFNILFDGKKPLTGYKGALLPKNLSRDSGGEWLCRRKERFCLVEVRGDWAWHVFIMGLKNRWTSTHLCFRCHAKAQRSGVSTLQDSYLDFSDSAGWLETEVSHIQFINEMLQAGPICAMAFLCMQ